MALTHLVDTSALKRLRAPAVRAAIEELAAAGVFARPTICDLEIGYSARNATEWERLIEALDAFEAIRPPAPTSVARSRFSGYSHSKQQSQRGRKIPDLLVAAAAEEHGLTVVHYDNDFDQIATGLRVGNAPPPTAVLGTKE